jgi:hypothetical protein
MSIVIVLIPGKVPIELKLLSKRKKSACTDQKRMRRSLLFLFADPTKPKKEKQQSNR